MMASVNFSKKMTSSEKRRDLASKLRKAMDDFKLQTLESTRVCEQLIKNFEVDPLLILQTQIKLQQTQVIKCEDAVKHLEKQIEEKRAELIDSRTTLHDLIVRIETDQASVIQQYREEALNKMSTAEAKVQTCLGGGGD